MTIARLGKKGDDHNMDNQYWTVKQSLKIIFGSLGVAIITGTLLGYVFFWDSYDDRSVIEKQLDNISGSKNNDATVLVEKAWLTLQNGNAEQAQEYLTQAIARDKNNIAAHYNLGLVYMKRSMYAEAIKAFNKTVVLDKDYFWGYYGLGQCYIEQKNYAKAVENLRTAEKLDGKTADVYYLLGKALEGLGAQAEAIAYYRQALEYVPDYPEATAALKRLKVKVEKG